MYLPFIINNINQTIELTSIKSNTYHHNDRITTYVISMYIIFIIWFIILFLYELITKRLRNIKIKKN